MNEGIQKNQWIASFIEMTMRQILVNKTVVQKIKSWDNLVRKN